MRKVIKPEERIPILRAAINGEPIAQQILLDYFDGFINAMSTITIYMPGGETKTYLDEDFKVQIQFKFLKSLNHFDLDGILLKNSKLRNTKVKTSKSKNCEVAGYDY